MLQLAFLTVESNLVEEAEQQELQCSVVNSGGQLKKKNIMLLQFSWATKVPKCVMPGSMPYRFGVKCECSVSGILR